MTSFIPGDYVGLLHPTNMFTSPFDAPPFAVGIVIGVSLNGLDVYVHWSAVKPGNVVKGLKDPYHPDDLMHV